MSFADQIKDDVKGFLTNSDEWGIPITFIAPDSPPVIVTINGTSTKHHLSVDQQGTPYNGKKSSITISEKSLTDLGYPVRNAKGKVDFKNHKVSYKDSAGNVGNFLIDEWFPDEKLGIIVCMLGEYKQ